MEITEGYVYHVRSSNSVRGKETVIVLVDSIDGFDGRVFRFQTEPGMHTPGDKITLEIDGNTATVHSA